MKMTRYQIPLFITGIFLILTQYEDTFSQEIQCSSTNTANNRIIVGSDFDCGSIDSMTVTGNFLSGKTKHWKQADNIGDQYYWFYFKLDHVRNQLVTVKLDTLIGNYRKNIHTVYSDRTLPVYSYDNIHWERITNSRYDTANHSLTFSHYFTGDQAWIAYAHPYPYSRGKNFIDNLPKDPDLVIEKIGRSHELRDINLLTITDKSVPDSGKKVVFITALLHAGEFPSGFIVEGLVAFLLSDDPVATSVRKKVIFNIAPMMNPDGIFHGITRYNAAREDLNAEWDDDTSDTINYPVEPEVSCVKDWLDKWFHQGNKMDMHVDLHSQSQQGDDHVMHMPVKGILKEFNANLNKYFKIGYIPMEFYGSSTNCLHAQYHIPSTVFEITQSAIEDEPYLTIEDYQYYGEGIVRAVHDYFQ